PRHSLQPCPCSQDATRTSRVPSVATDGIFVPLNPARIPPYKRQPQSSNMSTTTTITTTKATESRKPRLEPLSLRYDPRDVVPMQEPTPEPSSPDVDFDVDFPPPPRPAY